MDETKLEVHKDKTLQEATETAYKLLEYEGAISLDRCRLVKYDEFHENIEQSFNVPLDTPIGTILGGVKAPYMFDLFLETRAADQEFETYKTGGATLKVYIVNLHDESIGYPLRTRVYFNMTVGELKTQVAKLSKMPKESMRMVLEKYYDEPKLLTEPTKTLKAEGFNKSNKLFVESGVNNDDRSLAFSDSKLYKLVDQQANTIRMFVTLPHRPSSEAPPIQTEEDPDSYSLSPAWPYSKWYFEVEEEEEEDGHRVLVVFLDKRMMLSYFKKCLEPYVGVSSENFKIYRAYANNQEFESIRLNETLSSYSEDSRIIVKHGRALKKGEYRVKIYILSPKGTEHCKFLFDWVFAKGMTVLDSKYELLPAICEKLGIKSQIPVERLRLRQKIWKNPGSVYSDDKVYDEDIPIFTSWEAFAEVLDEPEKLQIGQQLLLFTKRWRPSELKVDPFQEVILNNCTIKELKKVLSEVSDISADDIEIAKGRGTFPCEISVLEMQSELDWNPRVKNLGEWPLYINDDGAVVYYRWKSRTAVTDVCGYFHKLGVQKCDMRDGKEELKELSFEEKQELKKTETARLGGGQ